MNEATKCDLKREDILRMAKEAGFEDGCSNHLFPPGDYKEEVMPVTDEIMRFAALVAAAEREACAKLCDELRDEDGFEPYGTECAAAIRARGER